ncbi:MAG: signal peptidase II [Lachnospiraceae bacterium]|jgi:signal peptidase II|nr:signal peptidase II [Lachnospiraceae bacterium]
MFFTCLAGFLCFIDVFFKELVLGTKDKEFPVEVPKTGGKLFLQKAENPGLPFGALKERQDWVKTLPLVTWVLEVGSFINLLTRKGNWISKTGYAFVIGGGASNLYDRYKRGYVVDYLNVRWKALEKMVFNLGDVFVLFGMVLRVIGVLIEFPAESKEEGE